MKSILGDITNQNHKNNYSSSKENHTDGKTPFTDDLSSIYYEPEHFRAKMDEVENIQYVMDNNKEYISKLEKDNEKLCNKLEMANKNIELSNEEFAIKYKKVKDERNKAIKYFKIYSEKYNKTKNQCEDLIKEKEKITKSFNDLTIENDDLKTENKNFYTNLESSTNESEYLKAELNQKTNEINKLKDKIEEQEEIILSNENEIISKNDDIQEYKNTINEYKNTIDEFKELNNKQLTKNINKIMSQTIDQYNFQDDIIVKDVANLNDSHEGELEKLLGQIETSDTVAE